MSRIEWCDLTINPIRVKGGGWHCTKISPACENCYAEKINHRFGNQIPYQAGHEVEYELDLSCFDKLPKSRPKLVFIQSMSDLFHEDLPREMISAVLREVLARQQHTFLLLTKRPWRMRAEMEYLFPKYPNIWCGISVEDEIRLTERAHDLLHTPAAGRFISAEPLLEPINSFPPVDWIICGGENGPRARRMDRRWALDLVWDAGLFTPVFYKGCGSAAASPSGLEAGLEEALQGCKGFPAALRGFDCAQVRS